MMYKGKFFIPVERNVGVETPTYGDYRLSSNRKVLKRKFSVLPENYVGVETPTYSFAKKRTNEQRKFSHAGLSK